MGNSLFLAHILSYRVAQYPLSGIGVQTHIDDAESFFRGWGRALSHERTGNALAAYVAFRSTGDGHGLDVPAWQIY